MGEKKKAWKSRLSEAMLVRTCLWEREKSCVQLHSLPWPEVTAGNTEIILVPIRDQGKGDVIKMKEEGTQALFPSRG